MSKSKNLKVNQIPNKLIAKKKQDPLGSIIFKHFNRLLDDLEKNDGNLPCIRTGNIELYDVTIPVKQFIVISKVSIGMFQRTPQDEKVFFILDPVNYTDKVIWDDPASEKEIINAEKN